MLAVTVAVTVAVWIVCLLLFRLWIQEAAAMFVIVHEPPPQGHSPCRVVRNDRKRCSPSAESCGGHHYCYYCPCWLLWLPCSPFSSSCWWLLLSSGFFSIVIIILRKGRRPPRTRKQDKRGRYCRSLTRCLAASFVRSDVRMLLLLLLDVAPLAAQFQANHPHDATRRRRRADRLEVFVLIISSSYYGTCPTHDRVHEFVPSNPKPHDGIEEPQATRVLRAPEL